MINRNSIPCLQYKTTVIFVDDSKDFLDYIAMALGTNRCYKYFISPNEAIEYLNLCKENTKKFIEKYLTISQDYASVEMPAINIDIPSLHHIIYDKHPIRFYNSIIVVSDYSMAEMDGLTFCGHLDNSFFKKIMLTGEATLEKGVQGLNNNIIDKFILKSGKNFSAELNKMIDELELNFFQECSSSIIDVLKQNKSTIFEDPIFIDFFNKIISENNIVEYYLQDELANFLMFDEPGNSIWLVVKGEEEMRIQLELAEGEKSIPKSILHGLENNNIIACFQNQEDKISSARSWLYQDAKVLQGNKKYYYAIIKGKDYFNIDRKKFLSFNDYKRSLK